jgi:hypothetical protein
VYRRRRCDAAIPAELCGGRCAASRHDAAASCEPRALRDDKVLPDGTRRHHCAIEERTGCRSGDKILAWRHLGFDHRKEHNDATSQDPSVIERCNDKRVEQKWSRLCVYYKTAHSDDELSNPESVLLKNLSFFRKCKQNRKNNNFYIRFLRLCRQ